MQDATWLEGWQGAAEGCGTPVAPHDGSNAATYEYDATAGTLTVTGDGAHIGLAKVHNTGEDGNSGGSVTYEVTELTDTTMTLDINFGPGYWRFKLVTADSVPVPVLPTTVAVTFQVDMAGVDTSAGVSVMGGAIFGQAGLAMSDDDGDGIYTVTTDLAMNSTVMFKYRNTTASTWDNQESVPADCGHGEWSDRQVVIAEDDITLDVVAFSSCTAGSPEPEPEPEPEPVANDNDQIAGEWKLAPEAGALGVGPGLGDIGWWSNSAADVDGRACLFDDTYTFGADDSFSNNMGDATWLEGWQGAAEGCGAPIAPHDGSNPATYVYDATAGTLTVTGDGAHIGLAKVHNTGEDGNSGGSITYTVTELTDTTMTLDINFGPGYWRFKLVSAEYVAPADVSSNLPG